MTNVAIVYYSSYGSTHAMAQRLAETAALVEHVPFGGDVGVAARIEGLVRVEGRVAP